MGEQYKLFDYEITTDPGFMDEQYAMTPELSDKLGNLYYEIKDGGGNKKTIEKILQLIEKHPKNPQLKNYLSVAYKEQGNEPKAREVNNWLISEHPGYFFGKLNLATQHYENEEYEKMPEVLGQMMEIQDLYPERKVFHLNEVTASFRFAIMYFSAIGEYENAASRYETLKEIAPDHLDTKLALPFLLSSRLKRAIKRIDEEEKTKIKVKNPSNLDTIQITTKPDFIHDEINTLYESGLFISKESIDKIISLPRKTLINDLEKVLQDLMLRYNYYKNLVETDGWDEETMTFPIHAMYILGGLRAEECLETVFNILRQNEEFIDFWFGDFITEILWEPLYYIANGHTEKLKMLVKEPGVYTYVRSEIYIVMKQIALHHPERKENVIDWFKDVARFYIDCKPESNIVDSDAIALMICELIDINASRLLPEIEKLYGLGYVSTGICGKLESVTEDILAPSEFDHKIELMNIADRYHEITTTWAGYIEDEDQDDIPYEDENDPGFAYQEPIVKDRKPGRNDPCFCGSGKKYKKCCMNK